MPPTPSPQIVLFTITTPGANPPAAGKFSTTRFRAGPGCGLLQPNGHRMPRTPGPGRRGRNCRWSITSRPFAEFSWPSVSRLPASETTPKRLRVLDRVGMDQTSPGRGTSSGRRALEPNAGDTLRIAHQRPVSPGWSPRQKSLLSPRRHPCRPRRSSSGAGRLPARRRRRERAVKPSYPNSSSNAPRPPELLSRNKRLDRRVDTRINRDGCVGRRRGREGTNDRFTQFGPVGVLVHRIATRHEKRRHSIPGIFLRTQTRNSGTNRRRLRWRTEVELQCGSVTAWNDQRRVQVHVAVPESAPRGLAVAVGPMANRASPVLNTIPAGIPSRSRFPLEQARRDVASDEEAFPTGTSPVPGVARSKIASRNKFASVVVLVTRKRIRLIDQASPNRLTRFDVLAVPDASPSESTARSANWSGAVDC